MAKNGTGTGTVTATKVLGLTIIEHGGRCSCGGGYEWLDAVGRDGSCGGGWWHCRRCGRPKP